MRLTIRHRTVYQFDQAVFLEPHIVRLRPRADAAVRPLSLDLQIDPHPAVRAENLDPEGNVVTQAWFEGMTDHLSIESRATVETLVTDPYRFLLDYPDRALPDVYPVELGLRLAIYRTTSDAQPATVRALAAAVAESVGHRQERFSWALTDRIHRELRVEVREDGLPMAPETTLAQQWGACRDLAVLFIACARSVGLAARFVSGYAHVETESGATTDAELHAWAEVFIPGGGWRGYDPTLGLAVADRHVAVAARAEPAEAAPVTGTFRGQAAARLENLVEIREI